MQQQGLDAPKRPALAVARKPRAYRRFRTAVNRVHAFSYASTHRPGYWADTVIGQAARFPLPGEGICR